MMISIFSQEDGKLNPQPGFWQMDKDRHSAILMPVQNELYEGIMRLKGEGLTWKSRLFVLTKGVLHCCKVSYTQSEKDRRPYKHVNISWKLFEAFTESATSEELFGFRLGSSDKFEDFYVESQAALEGWIAQIQTHCILQDLNTDYTLSASIGTGTFATVTLARDNETDTTAAIKSVKKSLLAESDENLQIHIQEIHALRHLSHPRIVQLLRVYEDLENIHLVLEYVAGGELYTRLLKRHKFSEPSAAHILREILQVVRYIHSEGFVHRDIKPENILMISQDDDREFKLADFGLAAEIGLGGLHMKCGSPGYLAPEMLRRNKYGPQVDIFSCGVLLYTLLSGRPPFIGDTSSEILLKNKECKIFFEPELWDGVSKEAITFVLMLTHPDPVQRLTADQALDNIWLAKKPPPLTPTVRVRRVSAELSNKCPEDHISHEFMRRMAGKVASQQKIGSESSYIEQIINPKIRQNCLETLRNHESSQPPAQDRPVGHEWSGEVGDEGKLEIEVCVKSCESMCPGALFQALNLPRL